MSLYSVQVSLQAVIGLAIVVGGVMLLALGVDRHSRLCQRALVCGLVVWGAWFAYLALIGRPDSPPAQAMALCVAVVLLCHGRQIRGILDGEAWWPKYSPHRRMGRGAR
jgi:drug/metabolite transporter (DMT)-like permease